jgi:hypothetical protein
MTLLVELMELITDTMVGVDQVSRDAAYSRAVDIAPFVDDLGAAGLDGGLTSCGEQAFCLGEAVLLFAVEPLITPEGIGLADVAVEQLEGHGVRIEQVQRRFRDVLAVAGTTPEGHLESRILASRGWVFLVIGPEHDSRSVTAILDERIAAIERSSVG